MEDETTMSTPHNAHEAPEGNSGPAFVVPRTTGKGNKRRVPGFDELYFAPPTPIAASDEFWTSRPYTPNAREANLLALGLGLSGLLISPLTTLFPVVLSCVGASGLTAVLAGIILLLAHYENPWWRVPSLLTIVCGLLNLASIVAWLINR
jgi:hypothetical protein